MLSRFEPCCHPIVISIAKYRDFCKLVSIFVLAVVFFLMILYNLHIAYIRLWTINSTERIQNLSQEINKIIDEIDLLKSKWVFGAKLIRSARQA